MGKTVFAINRKIRNILTCPRPRARGHYFAPTYKQAKSIAWDYLRVYTGHIPGMKYNKTELSADFPGGQRIQLVGSENIDSFRGQYSDDVTLDEIAMMPSRLWSEVVRPALADREGTALFIGTPAGRNAFYDLFEAAGDLEHWGRQILTVHDTSLIPPKEMAQLKREMSPEEWSQEFECSFNAAIRGAYYGQVMAEAQREGRITDVPYDPMLPVFTSCDLGIADAFAVVWWQISPGGQYRAIDYEEYHNLSLPQVIAEMRKKPYQNFEMHIAPHDIRVRELGTGMSRYEIAAQNGIHYHQAASLPLMDGIDACRNVLRKAWFDQRNCKDLINALCLYRTEEDNRGVMKLKPLHDAFSHGADAARYFAVTMGARQPGTWGTQINYDMLDRMAI